VGTMIGDIFPSNMDGIILL